MSTDQDMIMRMMYVIRPKDELISVMKNILDPEDLEDMSRPFVVMTEEHPFELYFESWQRGIIKACKEEYLMYESKFEWIWTAEFRNAIGVGVGNTIDAYVEKKDMRDFFDRWWQIERAGDYIEIGPKWLLPGERE